jgi:hypothetical protein
VQTWVRVTVELNRRKVGETINRKDKNTKSEASPKNTGNNLATARSMLGMSQETQNRL